MINRALISLVVFFCFSLCFAQELEIIEDFRDVKFGDSKFQVEVKVSKKSGYRQKGVQMTWDKEQYEDTTIQRSFLDFEKIGGGYLQTFGVDGNTQIYFSFCDGILYRKVFSFQYEKKNVESAEALYDTLISIMKDTYPEAKVYTSALTNKAYGSELGESKEFIITYDSDTFHAVRIDFSGEIKRYGDSDMWVIDGFSVTLRVDNLSHVLLNFNTGY